MAGISSKKRLTIILAVIIPSVFLITLGALAWHHITRRRKARYPNRGITPIGDEEIESWKTDKNKLMDEKPTDLPIFPSRSTHESSKSVGSVHHKPPSLIIYQTQVNRDSRASDDLSPWLSSNAKMSVENLPTPVLARAPNSRPGLTDESIQGDEAFVAQPQPIKRQQSRLSKLPSAAKSPRHLRTRSARSSVADFGRHERWVIQGSPRPSLDTVSAKSLKSPRAGRRATVSTPSRRRHSSSDDEGPLGDLPPPARIARSEIGQAIG